MSRPFELLGAVSIRESRFGCCRDRRGRRRPRGVAEFWRNVGDGVRGRKRSMNPEGKLAVRQGFEPWVGVYPLQRFSKPPLSATQPPHRDEIPKDFEDSQEIAGLDRPDCAQNCAQTGSNCPRQYSFGGRRRPPGNMDVRSGRVDQASWPRSPAATPTRRVRGGTRGRAVRPREARWPASAQESAQQPPATPRVSRA